MEFPTPEAKKEYLHEHPHADPEKHWVKKPESGGGKADEPKGLFSPDELSGLKAVVQQKEKDPGKLFAQAEKAHEEQLDWLNRGKGLDAAIRGKVVRVDQGDPKKGYKDVLDTIDYSKAGPLIIIGPMKQQSRSKEKVESDFGGDYSYLGDIVRASVAVDSMDDIGKVLKELRKSGLKLARIPKDRFAKPTDAGYRDLMMNVVFPNGHVGELQLHLKPVLKAKDDGHKFYEDVRSIEAKAKSEGRDTLTEEEQKTVDEANRKMRALYDSAWERATGMKNAMAHRVAARFLRASEVPPKAKVYEYNGLPAYIEHGKFPKLLTVGGKERTIYELQKFYREATPLDRGDFDKLVKDTSK